MSSKCQRLFLAVSSLTAVFLFSGIVFGWAAFNQMLLKQGYYAHKCGPEDPVHCDAQIGALNAAFTAASTAVSLVALPAGIFVDSCGPMLGALVAGVLNVIGLIGMALSKTIGSEEHDVFLYALVVQAIGGSLTMFCGYTVPFLFPSRDTLLIETNSCLFDASTIIFPIFKIVFDAGFSFEGILEIYAGVAAVSFFLLVVAWSFSIKDLKEIKERAGDAPADGNTEALSARPFGAQLRTLEFAAILVFTTIQIPRSNIYMGSVDLVNKHIVDQSGQVKYLDTVGTIIGLVIPFGFLSVPLIELCVHRGGIMFTVYLTTVIGWIYVGLQFVPELFTQLGTVVVFAAWRAFLFSIISAYNAEFFGPRSMGRVMGLSFLFSGLANFVQAPLISWTLDAQSGDFTWTLLIILLVSVPLPLLFVAVQVKQRRMGTFVARTFSVVRGESMHMTRVLTHGTAGGGPEPHVLNAAIERSRSTGREALI
ncbi:unnamed protein product [Prorocentrum cordatum]|uniref:Solute carrier family 40 protein n=1 Tax=Prorocentrum cordatum TaxID=2364126 RepID=A0ABN9U038_9DINO|nr:unnamed protein product [Polarella glacialis]